MTNQARAYAGMSTAEQASEIEKTQYKLLSHYIFGNKGQDYSHNYVRNYDEQEVYRTAENVFYMLNTSPTYWGKNPPEEQPEKEETTIDTTSSISPL